MDPDDWGSDPPRANAESNPNSMSSKAKLTENHNKFNEETQDSVDGGTADETPEDDDADAIIEAACQDFEALVDDLVGEPTQRLSHGDELRFGKKGSLSVETAKRVWFDHEADVGGGPLQLVEHFADGVETREDAIEWLRDWLDGEAPETTRQGFERDDVEDADREAAQEERRRWRWQMAERQWQSAFPVAGTLGEKYLCETRKLPSTDWPFDAVRFCAATRTLIFAATDDAGKIEAFQHVYVAPDATKEARGAAQIAKRTIARDKLDGAVVRLFKRRDMAANSPILVAEGLETGLTVWAATGCSTAVCLGLMARYEPPSGRRIVYCADDDPRFANSRTKLRKAVGKRRDNGEPVIIAYPHETRRFDKSDFNDLLQEEGIEAVRKRLAQFMCDPPKTQLSLVTLEEASQLLKQRIETFAAEGLKWLRQPDFYRDLSLPPVSAMSVSLGVGKTQAIIEEATKIVGELRAAERSECVAIAVPCLNLADEVAGRLRKHINEVGANLTVRVYRGRDANNPEDMGKSDPKKMCRNLREVKKAQRVLADVRREVCRICDYNREGVRCAYLAQDDLCADVWVFAHNYVFSQPPTPVTKAGVAFLFIDEDPLKAGLVISDDIESEDNELDDNAKNNTRMLLADLGEDGMILPDHPTEPPRICRRPQLLRDWGYGSEEEDIEQIFT